MFSVHLEFLVEEPSMEAFLNDLLPRLLPQGCTFAIHPFNGKPDLIGKLGQRLRGYARWIPNNWRIVVVVDRDDDDCIRLKQELESVAQNAHLRTRTAAQGGATWQVVNRIAIEELEAWYFGDWDAVRAAYPKVPKVTPANARYRNPDAIQGGTWESFERILQKAGYFQNGLCKIEAAQTIAAKMNPARNTSKSFLKLMDVVREIAEHCEHAHP